MMETQGTSINTSSIFSGRFSLMEGQHVVLVMAYHDQSRSVNLCFLDL